MRSDLPTWRGTLARSACIMAVAASMVACQSSTGVALANEISATGGDAQKVAVNTAASQPLSVVVQDTFGNPVRNAAVNWKVVSGNGTVQSVMTKTGLDGTASNTFVGGAAGDAVVTATVAGIYDVTFTEHVGS